MAGFCADFLSPDNADISDRSDGLDGLDRVVTLWSCNNCFQTSFQEWVVSLHKILFAQFQSMTPSLKTFKSMLQAFLRSSFSNVNEKSQSLLERLLQLHLTNFVM